MNKILSILLLILLSAPISMKAQSTVKTTIAGKVYDSEEGGPLQSCTVIVMKSDTTGLITGTTTQANGSFTIKNVPDGNYIVKVSFMGYHNFFRALTIKHFANPAMNMGTIMLTPNTVELNSVVVTGQAQEVEVKEDTLIFNAAAFKVPEGSVLEELIRKIPGAEVDENGGIKINGKTVRKILVEGKEFFSTSTQMAMKNIPTEIVEKVKAYDKKSDLARITGIDDGEEETVLDLSIKKGMKQGWFGNVDAAYGTRNRFAERLTVNRFTDKRQATLLGSYNNINDASFPGGGGGRGGGGGNGVSTNGMAGANIALDFDKIEVGGNVRFTGRKSDNQTKSSSQNFVSTNASFSNSRNQSISHNTNFNGDFKIEWKPDTMTTILFRPNFSVGKNDSESTGLSATFNNDPYKNGVSDPLEQIEEIEKTIRINRNQSHNLNEGNNYNFNGNLMLNRRLHTYGRNVSLRFSGSTSRNENKSYNSSSVDYYQKDSTDLTYRHRSTPSSNQNFSAGITYSEPILRNLFAQFNYNYQFQNRHSDGATFDFAKIDSIGQSLIEIYGFGYLPPDYLTFRDDSLSRYTDNRNNIHNLELSLRYVTDHINLNAGVQFQQQRQKMSYQYQGLDTIASRSFSRLTPTLNFRYRFTRQHSLRVTYRGSTQQPDMTDLFTLTDNSNPLNIREGNPNLKPSFNNNIGFEYNNFFALTQRSVFIRTNFSNTINQITNRTEYNELTGGQISRPENINGSWNVNGSVGFNTPLIWDNLILNTNTSVQYNNNVSYIYQKQTTLTNHIKHIGAGERISLRLKLQSFEIEGHGNINYSGSKSDIVEATNQNTFNFSYGVSSNGNFQNGFGFSTNLSMNSRRGYSSTEMNTNELIWNAQISYRFLKNRQATVSLQAYDILNQRSNISRTISAYSRRDSENNSIRSYFMLHFIYRLNMFGSRQARQQLHQNNREAQEGGGYERQSFGGNGMRGGTERGGMGGGRRF